MKKCKPVLSMRRAMHGAIAFMALALVLFGAYRNVSAQEESKRGNPPASAPVSHNAMAPSFATNHVLERNYLVHGTLNGIFFPANTYTAVDSPLKVQCPGMSGKCTIVADMWVQTGNANAEHNNYAVCLYVDGVNVDKYDSSNGCNYTEDTPSDGTAVEGSEENSLSGVALGSHTVQTFLYTNNGTPVFNYNISYHVYKP